MLGAATEHQSRVSDQSEPEQTLQKQFARREHSLEVFLSRFQAILFDCLQEQPQVLFGQPATDLGNALLA
ncbi:hypothetical protein D3C77_630960 [compost metagenome]